MLLSGCDFVRRSLGMPTSDELDAKKTEILKTEAQKKAKADSVAKALKMAQDSASMKKSDPSKDYLYYIVVGVFEEKKNAERVYEQISGLVEAPIMKAWAGMTMVAAGGADTMSEATVILEKIRPTVPDAWVYKNIRRPVEEVEEVIFTL